MDIIVNLMMGEKFISDQVGFLINISIIGVVIMTVTYKSLIKG